MRSSALPILVEVAPQPDTRLLGDPVWGEPR